MGHDVAVEDEADVFAGAVGGQFGLAGGGVPAFAAFEHVEGGGNGTVVGGFGDDGAAHCDADALFDEADGLEALLGGDEVDGAKLVVGTPASPVAEGFVVFADFCGGGYGSGHGCASRVRIVGGWLGVF